MTRMIANSELQTFKRCRRKWWLAYYRRLRKAEVDPTGPLRSGTRVHAALEAYYVPEGENPSDPREVLNDVLEDDWNHYLTAMESQGFEPPPDVVKQFKKDSDLERAMVDGYMEWLEESGSDAHLEVIESEKKVQVDGSTVVSSLGTNDFRTDWSIIGKLDVQMRDTTDDSIKFMDHKTARSLTEPLKTLQQSEQMLHYHLLQMFDNPEQAPTGALYNMLKKVKRTAKATPPFYARHMIVHNEDEVISYLKHMLAIIDTILGLEEQLDRGGDPQMLVYPTVTPNCAWDCDFKTVCSMFDDGSRVETALEDHYTTHDPMKRYQ